MKLRQPLKNPVRVLTACLLLLSAGTGLRALEHVTLRNGFEFDCDRQETVGERLRLYLATDPGASAPVGAAGYLEVGKDAVLRVDALPNRSASSPAASSHVIDSLHPPSGARPTSLTPADMHQMLAHAGAEHRVDEDLLASVVRAESGGRVAAISRTGARGLMQLMPQTAAAMGVADAFIPEQNINGGSAYLDWLLTRYHDDVALALAGYNAGPAAVDRFHGVPPFRETRAYVATVIREFNRRKLARR